MSFQLPDLSSDNGSPPSKTSNMLDPLFPAAISSQTLSLLNAAGHSVQTSHSYSSSPDCRPLPPEPAHATNFDAIQGRFASLEKGPNADKELRVSGG